MPKHTTLYYTDMITDMILRKAKINDHIGTWNTIPKTVLDKRSMCGFFLVSPKNHISRMDERPESDCNNNIIKKIANIVV